MRRALLILLAIMVLVPMAALAAAHFVLTPDWLKARFEEAARRATGRELTIAGPVRLAWSLTPSIQAKDVSLANPPGLSRPAMAHLDRVEAQIALAPLLSRRVEVRRLVLAGPDVLLERDAAGRPNWVFAQTQAAPSAAPSTPSRARMELVLGAVEIRDARIGWRDRDRTGSSPVQVQAPTLDYAPGTNEVRGALVVNGVPLALTGYAGPAEGTTWAMLLNIVGGGVNAWISGTPSQPSFSVTATDLASVSALASRELPKLQDVLARATLSAGGLSEVRISVGAGELGGVRLVRARLEAPAMDQPVTSTGELAVGRLPVAFAANAGSLRALLGGGPIPIQLRFASGDATLSGEGTVADLRGDGLQLAVTGAVSDLGKLGALAGVAVPALRDVAIQARLATARPGLIVRGLRLTSSAGDLAGDLALGLMPRISIGGTLVSQRLDLDGLTPQPLAAPNAPSAPAPSAPASPASDRVIPNNRLPLAALRAFDADLHVDVAEAVWRGASFRAVDAVLKMQDGSLRLDPVTLQGPGGPVRARLTAEAEPPAVGVSAQAPGLAAGPVLALFGAPGFSSGAIDLDVDLHGQGDTPRALAATLDGHLGAAMVDGEVDNRRLADMLGDALRAASLPAETGGRSHVRCAAIRADAHNGQVKLPAIALDTAKLDLAGEGELNLADETMTLHLRPQLRLGALLAVPVRITGAFRAPKVALDPGVLGSGRVGLTIGGPAAADICGPALALARDGHAGSPPPPAEPDKKLRPADLLRSLLR